MREILRRNNEDPEGKEKHPGILEPHWIPMDPPDLWRQGNYLWFLEARQELLPEAANDVLDSLLRGTVPETEEHISILNRPAGGVGGIMGSEEEEVIAEARRWVSNRGLPEGELLHEGLDEDPGEPTAVLDLARRTTFRKV